jgi:hypothetical protein
VERLDPEARYNRQRLDLYLEEFERASDRAAGRLGKARDRLDKAREVAAPVRRPPEPR